MDKKILNLKKNHPDLTLTFVDMNSLFQKLIDEGKKLSMNTVDPCITDIANHHNAIEYLKILIEIFETGKIRYKYKNGCSYQKIDSHFFFDYVHPTKWGHEKLGNEMYNLLLSTYEFKSITKY